MNLAALRPLLRAAIIPLGAALVMRGLQDLRDEADQLAPLVAARRAYLAGAGPDPDEDEDEDLADEPPAPDYRITGNTNPVNRPRTRQRSALIAAGAGLAGLVLGVAAGRQLAGARAQLAEQPAPFFPDHPWNVIRSLRLTDDSVPGPDEDEDLADEQPAPDEDEDLADEQPAPADPYACPECGYVAAGPGVSADARRTLLVLHRNGHAAGLPGR